MLTLHHGPGSVCSQKVRIALAEKGLEWESRLPGRGGMRTPEYLALNPDGVVPTLVHDGQVVRESRLINEYLEDAFPAAPPLRPADPYTRYRQAFWSRQADDSLHLAIFSLMFVISRRDDFIKAPREEWRKRLPGMNDPIKQERTYDLAVNGFGSAHVAEAVARLRRLIADMEQALSETPWLAGPDYSLADAEATPYLNRAGQLGLATLWSHAPRTSEWFERVRARPSFDAAVARWEKEEDIVLMANGAEKAADRLAPLLGA